MSSAPPIIVHRAEVFQTERSAGPAPGALTGWLIVAAAAFHLAYSSAAAAFAIIVYLFALVRLAYAETPRKAFYSGLVVGLLIAAGRLEFFWRIFGPAAIALWLVYAFWIGAFVMIARLIVRQFRFSQALWAIPVAWTGLEYFRSELYYLRFSWLTPGLAFGLDPKFAPINVLGVYGVGFCLMLAAAAAAMLWDGSKIRSTLVLGTGLAVLGLFGWISQPATQPSPATNLKVAGVQLEFPSEKEVLVWLNETVRRHPEAQLLLLSEYTFMGPVPDSIRSWCREHQRYLVIGAKDPASSATFYDTAFVIAPSGEIVFRQAKSIPIQFFNDGLPASEQRLWESPWGKLGICICYDLSYTRVTDRLVSLGAQALIVPTMDVLDWGKRQHELHARIGPIRAAEYHIPVVRLASSGISQVINLEGRVLAEAPFAGDGAILAASMPLSRAGRRPLDRWFAPISAGLVALGSAGFMINCLIRGRRSRE